MSSHDADHPGGPDESPKGWLARWLPGVAALAGYRLEWLRGDLIAGVSVAAVAIPVAVAYSEIAGFPPIVGLYSAILPLLAYALLGTSRHLIVNPDAATAAMVAAVCGPLAAGDAGAYQSMSVALAMMAGALCILGGVLRLGLVADFLSRPILLGLLNGVAIEIFLGQIGKVFGFKVEGEAILPRLWSFATHVSETHWPTLGVATVAFLILFAGKRFLPRWPAPLIAMLATGAMVALLRLDERGVSVVGEVQRGLPSLALPRVDPAKLTDLFGGACGLALVVFSKGMLDARVFALKNGYDVDADREMIAIGAANIAAGASQGFAVSGTDSRTAIADMMGGRSQATGLVVAGLMVATLLSLTGPLAYLPTAGLGAILVGAAVGLFHTHDVARLWRVSRSECALSVATTLAVVVVGVLPGILSAVALAIVRILVITRRPIDCRLGRVPGIGGFHNIADFPHAAEIPAVVIYRFEAAIVFFNAPYFKQRALAAAAARPGVKWLVLDASASPLLDATGVDTIAELHAELEKRGITLAIAGPRKSWRNTLERAGVLERIGYYRIYATIKAAAKSYYEETGDAEVARLGVWIDPEGTHGGQGPNAAKGT